MNDMARKKREFGDAPPPPPSRWARALGSLRNNFLTGLVVAAPIGITIYLTWNFIAFVDNRVTPLIPDQYSPPFTIPGLGLLIVFVALLMLGIFTKNLFGRSIIKFGDRVIARMPVVRSIYGALKQIFETVAADHQSSFQQVGLIQYPREGIWAVVFVTTQTKGEITAHADPEMVSVFLPTTPNPTSGFLLFVPKSEIVILDMTVEQAAKLIISAGIVEPDHPSSAAGFDAASIDEARRMIEEKMSGEAAGQPDAGDKSETEKVA